MKKEFNKILSVFALTAASLSFSACSNDKGPEILVTDIPSDENATANPELEDVANATIPNVQYGLQREEGHAVLRMDMTGIRNNETNEWIRLIGTGEEGQNIWVEVDDMPKGIRVHNTIDDANLNVPVDLVFCVDNSGSMSEEADAIARDIIAWSQLLEASGIDIRFACVGYDGEITGAINFTSANTLSIYLEGYGTNRTVGFSGTDGDKLKSVAYNYRTGGGSNNECGMAAVRYANDNFSFRTRANRIYVNFTDEPNQPNRNARFSVESLLTDWDTTLGTIHTVFSDYKTYDNNECNALMSEYTGGTVLYTDSSFSGISLEDLPVSDAMRNSYVIRFTNIDKQIDGQSHKVRMTIQSQDKAIRAEKTFMMNFEDSTTE